MTTQFSASPGPLARLQLDTEPYDSPLPSHRSTLRRDSHILAEISEMESTFANQEQVNTNTRPSTQPDTDQMETSLSQFKFSSTNQATIVNPTENETNLDRIESETDDLMEIIQTLMDVNVPTVPSETESSASSVDESATADLFEAIQTLRDATVPSETEYSELAEDEVEEEVNEIADAEYDTDGPNLRFDVAL